jgi:hypothetical protein
MPKRGHALGKRDKSFSPLSARHKSLTRSQTSGSTILDTFSIRKVIGKYFQTRCGQLRAQCLRMPTIGPEHAAIGFSDKRATGGDFDLRKGASHTLSAACQ